ncbi:hypothetical protein LguiA_027112 [Lonicera macranthoides]
MRAGGYLVRNLQIRPLISRGRVLKKEKQQQFVYLVFRQHLCRLNLTQLSDGSKIPPCLEILIWFPGKCLPVGIGAFSYGSGIYLIGGERISPPILAPEQRFIHPRHLMCYNRNVYFFNPKPSGRCSYDIEPVLSMCPMTGGKPGAKAVIVDGELYVFTAGQHCFPGVVPTPRFESYNFLKNSWRKLPDPPFYDDLSPISYVNLSVMGREIYVNSGSYYLVFDLDFEQWRDDYDYIRLEPFPFEFDGSIAEGDYGIFVAYTVVGLVAYRDSTFTCPHLLLPLSLFPSPPDPMGETSFIRHLGRNVFCHVLTVVFKRKIHITTFVVRGMQDDDDDLLQASLLGHHVYDMDLALGKDNYPPNDVFTILVGQCFRYVKFNSGSDQSTVSNSHVPRRKRSAPKQIILSPIQRFQWKLYCLLQEPEFSKLCEEEEDVLVYHDNSSQMPSSTNEIGLGAMLLKPPTSPDN